MCSYCRSRLVPSLTPLGMGSLRVEGSPRVWASSGPSSSTPRASRGGDGAAAQQRAEALGVADGGRVGIVVEVDVRVGAPVEEALDVPGPGRQLLVGVADALLAGVKADVGPRSGESKLE